MLELAVKFVERQMEGDALVDGTMRKPFCRDGKRTVVELERLIKLFSGAAR